ncbi:MAG: ATP-dependent DNA ligase [Agromyces sp.]
MGQFVYNARGYDVDDRSLAHLQVVIIDRLRRGESCSFTLDLPKGGRVELWLSPAAPIMFEFSGNRQPRLNRAWLEILALAGYSVEGLRLLPEPPDPDA